MAQPLLMLVLTCGALSRFGPHYKIEPSQDFTSLTLEALCLCAMSYRYAGNFLRLHSPSHSSCRD